ncbi:MAG: hypothetical protein LBC13_01770 [Clostridiales bacterium]|jgi:hypothetical protein|nr:hypothetical protein [Clostridiales bacterium]
MVFSGETLNLIGLIDFNGKTDIYKKLSDINAKAAYLPAPDATIVKEMTEAAMQEIVYCDEREIMDYKRYLRKRSGK